MGCILSSLSSKWIYCPMTAFPMLMPLLKHGGRRQ